MKEFTIFGAIFVVFLVLGQFEASGWWLIPVGLALLLAVAWYAKTETDV